MIFNNMEFLQALSLLTLGKIFACGIPKVRKTCQNISFAFTSFVSQL